MITRRRHNVANKVIQRTTSETIRIGEPNVSGRPVNLCPTNGTGTASGSGGRKAASSSSASFVVTAVSTRVDPAACATCESPDDSEDISRQTDIETPSISEDTSYSQYTEDVDHCACDEIILKQCVNAVMSSTEDLLAQKACIHALNYSKASNPISINVTRPTVAACGQHIPSPGRFIGRFQVVKVESIHPFRRGRWICHDYVDNSEYAPKDGYEFFAGKFVKREEVMEIKKKMLDADNDTFFFDPILREDNEAAIQQSPVTLVHDSRTPLVFMNAPLLSSTYHPILRTEATADSFKTANLLSSSNSKSTSSTTLIRGAVPNFALSVERAISKNIAPGAINSKLYCTLLLNSACPHMNSQPNNYGDEFLIVYAHFKTLLGTDDSAGTIMENRIQQAAETVTEELMPRIFEIKSMHAMICKLTQRIESLILENDDLRKNGNHLADVSDDVTSQDRENL